MRAALKSEIRKLLTIRSTYIIMILAMLLTGVINGYGSFRATGALTAHTLANDVILPSIAGLSGFVAVVSLLMITHEYRYNTIFYSLTATQRRTQFLLAKILAFSLFAVCFVFIMTIVSVAIACVGHALAGHTIPSQHIDWWNTLWRCVYFTWGTAALAALFGVLIRNQVGAIIGYFVGITSIEGLLSAAILKHNAIYLPGMALNNVLQGSAGQGNSPLKGLTISAIWLVGGWLLAWTIFLRRDAN